MFEQKRLLKNVVLVVSLFAFGAAGCSDDATTGTKTNNTQNADMGMEDSSGDNNETDMTFIPRGCGNGVLEAGEACDDGDLNSNTAADTCRTNCTQPRCGDGVQDEGEGCDSGAMNSDAIPGRCRTTCSLATCGDGTVDEGEECDGDTGSSTCNTAGFTEGDLGCSETCMFDTTLCTMCGDGTADGTEECDDADLRGETCVTKGFAWGTLGCSTCTLDTTECSADPAVCVNNIVEDMEVCDGTDLVSETCVSQGFTGGTLACVGDCTAFDPANCYTCGNGIVEPGEVCDDGNTVGDGTCSSDCQYACEPGFAECTLAGSSYCDVNDQGIATLVDEACDNIQGVSCDAQSGRCDGACSSTALGTNYIGCDYFPTITANVYLPVSFSFAVTVANSGLSVANITVTRGATAISTTTVLPGDVAVINLPWVESLRTAVTTMVTDGAYRVRTDQPVTVYQYNPLDYTSGGAFSYTNDASLLLPTNTWTGNYVVVSRENWAQVVSPGFYAITAKDDNTSVTLSPSATGGQVVAGAGVAADGTGTVVLGSGDVLHVSTSGGDLTGTSISADKNIQVVAGHNCTNVPIAVTACDHLEESMPPLETVGTSYIVTEPLITATTGKARMVRIVATEASTTVSYDPPQAGAPTTLANAGDYFEIASTTATFQITGDKKIMVAQYMLGQTAGGGIGDPAMTLAVPVQQYRTDYLFHAPTSYQTNYLNVIAPTGSVVMLDGAAIIGWATIGATGYDFARVQLSNAGDGNHNISSANPFGISVYGYGQYTSYWYPGGLDLNEIK